MQDPQIADSLRPTAKSSNSEGRNSFRHPNPQHQNPPATGYTDHRNQIPETRAPATGRTDHRNPVPETRAPAARPSRAKRHFAWEKINRNSGGIFGAYYHDLLFRYPTLTPMELMIAALVKGKCSNIEIAESLNICEETVENHRVNIRRKLGLTAAQNLMRYLITEN